MYLKCGIAVVSRQRPYKNWMISVSVSVSVSGSGSGSGSGDEALVNLDSTALTKNTIIDA